MLTREIEELEKVQENNRQANRKLKQLRSTAQVYQERLDRCHTQCAEEQDTDHEDPVEPEAKRLASEYIELVSRDAGIPSSELWDRIQTVISGSVLALVPSMLKHTVTTEAAGCGHRSFALLGADIILDTDLTPHFLEWNSCPSLKLSSRGIDGRLHKSQLDVQVRPQAQP